MAEERRGFLSPLTELFGFEIVPTRSKEEEDEEKNRKSFVPPTNDDGAIVTTQGGIYGTHVDLDGTVRTEAELITRYRTISQDPTVDMAITDICNEAIVDTDEEEIVTINLDDHAANFMHCGDFIFKAHIITYNIVTMFKIIN